MGTACWAFVSVDTGSLGFRRGRHRLGWLSFLWVLAWLAFVPAGVGLVSCGLSRRWSWPALAPAGVCLGRPHLLTQRPALAHRAPQAGELWPFRGGLLPGGSDIVLITPRWSRQIEASPNAAA
jgi:hypothetical protein